MTTAGQRTNAESHHIPTGVHAYRERLLPGPWMFVMWLLLIPAVLLAVTPLTESLALPIALFAYVVVVVSFCVMSPVVSVTGSTLSAGTAHIDVAEIGSVETLNAAQLRAAIGPGSDARDHLVIRGYIHSGVRVEITDPSDPTPHWIVTTRRPELLRQAIVAAQSKD